MMLSQSTIGLVLAVASLVSAQPTELTARAQVTYPEATAFKEPMADGRCGGSELGTANMHDGHQRSESFMGMANFGSKCVATPGAECYEMGGQKIHDPRTKCHLWLYKSGDCDGSEASKKMGKLQKPFKKIKMTGDETRVATVGDEEFGSMLVDCKVNDLDKLSF